MVAYATDRAAYLRHCRRPSQFFVAALTPVAGSGQERRPSPAECERLDAELRKLTASIRNQWTPEMRDDRRRGIRRQPLSSHQIAQVRSLAGRGLPTAVIADLTGHDPEVIYRIRRGRVRPLDTERCADCGGLVDRPDEPCTYCAAEAAKKRGPDPVGAR